MSLPRFAIRRPITVYMMCIVAILLGAISFFLLPVDLMPDIEFPSLTVFTEYTGVAPEEMETLITRPIERSVSSAPGVEEITATSSEGQSRVTVSSRGAPISTKRPTRSAPASTVLGGRCRKTPSRRRCSNSMSHSFPFSSWPLPVSGIRGI